MEIQKQDRRILQWHPAFYAGFQIELQREADNLLFENEHQLGTKPKEIDVLIIKKETGKPIDKNIGRIFRKYNIVEYKSPADYFSVDDFYRVYGYACFYKADSALENQISVHDITITLVCHKYPKSLARHLEKERQYRMEQEEEGIYYIKGDIFPMQLIVTSELSAEKNLWLRSLTNDLDKGETARKLIEDYARHKGNEWYRSVMNIIVHANKEAFEEVKDMCEALEELMKDELEAREIKGMEQGMEQGIEIGIMALVQDNLEEGTSLERICEKLQIRFGISREGAQEYIQKALNPQTI